MEPGIEEGRDGTLEAFLWHWQDADGAPVHAPEVNLGRKSRLMQQMEEAIDWLVWEDSGQRLAELAGRGPDSSPR
jgi:hypothetical protein